MNIPNYDKNIVVGNLRSDIRESITALEHYTITDETVLSLYPALFDGGTVFAIAPGESSKSLDVANDIARDMLKKGFKRNTTIVAVGGGVVSDVAGFVASIYMRGIDWVCVPTTLLAQVDASNGGKTGVNIEDYKNVIGSFYLPRQIFCDINILATLDDRQWLSGVGEILKTALLNQELWQYFGDNLQLLMQRDQKVVQKVVTACMAIKSNVVALDFKDKGLRQNLNIGHTIGHALESLDNFALTHGEYVLLGINIETTLFSHEIDVEYLQNLRLTLKKISPNMMDFSVNKLLKFAAQDKKNKREEITFVVPVALGQVKTFSLKHDELKKKLNSLKDSFFLNNS